MATLLTSTAVMATELKPDSTLGIQAANSYTKTDKASIPVVRGGDSISVSETTGKRGEPVYTVYADTSRLVTKAELGVAKVGVMGNYARIENNRKAI